MVQDNDEEVDVIRMVNECFKKYDDLPKYTNIIPNKEEIDEKFMMLPKT